VTSSVYDEINNLKKQDYELTSTITALLTIVTTEKGQPKTKNFFLEENFLFIFCKKIFCFSIPKTNIIKYVRKNTRAKLLSSTQGKE